MKIMHMCQKKSYFNKSRLMCWCCNNLRANLWLFILLKGEMLYEI